MSKKSIELGAVWKKKDRNGKTFLSGTMNIFPFGTIQVTIFENSYKNSDSHPDMKIYYNPPELAQAPGGLERSGGPEDHNF